MPPSAPRILLTGINGQLGSALLQQLSGYDVVALDRTGLDLARPESIRKAVREIQPSWIINPAAYTAVDKAESEPDIAFALNATAPAVFAEEAARIHAILLHYSTDYVFEGTGTTPYVETDLTHPRNTYGSTKLAGEQAILAGNDAALIFRTSWVYNATGKNFLRTILRLAREKQQLNIVADQHGAPTSTADLAAMTRHTIAHIQALAARNQSSLAEAARPLAGLYHATGTGETTWYGFATAFLAIARQQNPDLPLAELIPIPTSAFPTPAIRPLNSRLNCTKLANSLNFHLPHWEESLSVIMRQVAHR